MPAPRKSSKEDIRRLVRELDERTLLAPLRTLCRSYGVTVAEVLGRTFTPRVVRCRDEWLIGMMLIGFSSSEASTMVGLTHTCGTKARERWNRRIDSGKESLTLAWTEQLRSA